MQPKEQTICYFAAVLELDWTILERANAEFLCGPLMEQVLRINMVSVIWGVNYVIQRYVILM